MGTTTSIKKQLFGETAAYSVLLEEPAAQLNKQFDNEFFAPLFTTLPHRSITVGPMAMCVRLAIDLGSEAPGEILQALGVLCFHISVHDDLIDEPPESFNERAALLYTGNISFIEGVRLLNKQLPPEKVSFICNEIERNHYLQQRCAETLWSAQPRSFEEYLEGVQHDGALIGIGVCTALAICGREDLWPQLMPICRDYGVALQLLDDINEADSDKEAGYSSYPVVEGAPFSRSLQEVDRHAKSALGSLDPMWSHFGELIENVRTVKNIVEKKVSQ